MSWVRVCTAGADLVNGLSSAIVPAYVDEDFNVMISLSNSKDVFLVMHRVMVVSPAYSVYCLLVLGSGRRVYPTMSLCREQVSHCAEITASSTDWFVKYSQLQRKTSSTSDEYRRV